MIRSPWSENIIDVDPYDPNPLLEVLKKENPAIFALASRGGPPPTMFVGGDLPAFTASGLDPATLNNFPWNYRHAVAAEPNASTVYLWLQEFATDEQFDLPHDGRSQFVAALTRWAQTSGTKATPSPADDDATYAALFGDDKNGNN